MLVDSKLSSKKEMVDNFSIKFFEKDDNDQKDPLYFYYLKKLVNHDVDIFPKPVAFVNRKDRAKHKKTPADGLFDDVPSIAKTCGCLNTFLVECNKRQVRPRVFLYTFFGCLFQSASAGAS